MGSGGCTILTTGAIKQLVCYWVHVGVADCLVANLHKPRSCQLGNVRHRDCGVRTINALRQIDRSEVFLAGLTVVPNLNWTALRQLIRQAHVRRFRDATDVDVNLVRCAVALANNGVQQVNSVRRHGVHRLPCNHWNLTLLYSPEVQPTICPFNGQKVQ